MNRADAISDRDLFPEDAIEDFIEGRCPDCGADFEDEHTIDCGYADDEDEDDDADR